MEIEAERLKYDGFSDEEIRQVQASCAAAKAAGRFSRFGTVVHLNGDPRWCYRTVAAILNRIRPGWWSDGPADERPAADKRIEVYWTYGKPLGSLSGESLWGRRINRNTAKIDDIPIFARGLALGDLVRIDDNNEIVKVLDHGARTCGLLYQDGNKMFESPVQRRAEVQAKLAQY